MSAHDDANRAQVDLLRAVLGLDGVEELRAEAKPDDYVQEAERDGQDRISYRQHHLTVSLS